MKKKIKLTHKKERVVLSELLPYEIPLTFSNRHFYQFLINNSISYSNEKFSWIHTSHEIDHVIMLLLGEYNNRHSYKILSNGRAEIATSSSISIPFSYGITHKEDELRRLSIAHPKNQVISVNFYDRYKDLIIYYCQKSKFSLRAPVSIAKCVYWDDKTHLPTTSEPEGSLEEPGIEYSNLKSFFVYNKYSNIFKFFESKEYHACEKKYNNMARLDISKCFDSIYTHSIAWSIFGKETVKNVISGIISGSLKKSFPEKFDNLLQRENYCETNGIIIGPEQSRIFAEIILQSVDDYTARSLESENIIYKKDYEISRYVDDYFVFFNDGQVYKEILKHLQHNLKHFKLNLNTEKERIYHKPIITEITIAKKQISNLLNEKIKYKTEEDEINKDGETQKITKGNIYIRSGSLITEFKTIIKNSDVEYKDILNYSLAIMESKCKNILTDYRKIHKTPASSKSLVHAISSIIDFLFFIYSVSPRVNTTVKLCRTLYVFIAFLRTKNVSKDQMDGIFKQIFENIYFVANKNKSENYTQVETLYLLTILAELGRDYRIEEEVLASYFCAKKDPDSDRYIFKNNLNHFSITVALSYMKNKVRYGTLRDSMEKHIIERFNENTSVLHKDTEKVLLLFDSISCPFLSEDMKREALSVFDVTDYNIQSCIMDCEKAWFTKWEDFDFGEELDAKRSLEVY